MINKINEAIFAEVDKELQKKLFDYTPQQYGILKTQLKEKINSRLDREKCVLCHSSSGKANSHNIPLSILKNISSNGFLSTSATHMIDKNYFIFPTRTGLIATQTFNIICDDCENTKFCSYENEAIENDVPYNDIQYNELELKILLYLLYYKKYILQFYTIATENIKEQFEFVAKSLFLNDDIKAINLEFLSNRYNAVNTDRFTCSKDVLDLEKLIKINRNSKKRYDSVFDTIISHKTGFALSQGILPSYSETGVQVNRTTDSTLYDYKFGYLCIAVFPLSANFTRICVFYNNKYEGNLGFIKREFDKLLTMDAKLKKLSDLILLYTDKLVIDESKETLFKQIYVDYPELIKLDPTKIRDPKEYLSIVSKIKDVNIFNI